MKVFTMAEDQKSEANTRPIDQEKQEHDVVTVVFTADNHLGYTTFSQSHRKREERRQRLRHAFQQVTDFAIGQGVDLFIQAGDLFDTPTPDEQDRSFVAARLAQLRQAGIRIFALGGVHDTPSDSASPFDDEVPAPQVSYARLGALHYFPPHPTLGTLSDGNVGTIPRGLICRGSGLSLPWGTSTDTDRPGAHFNTPAPQTASSLEPVLVDIHGMRVGICGLGVLAGQEGDPLASVRVHNEIERAALRVLILHAPIEGLATGSSLLDKRTQVSRTTLANQSFFRFILAGYHHGYSHLHIGQSDLIVAGATQHIDFSDPGEQPGFVFLGLAADGMRWCKHIATDALQLKHLVIQTAELWPAGDVGNVGAQFIASTPTATILERLRPLCMPNTMIQLRLEGALSRGQYHQLDLNSIRRYGEEHCFALAIDDSTLALLPEQEAISIETGERFSPREELILLADEWITEAKDEQEEKTLRATKEELLVALDEMRQNYDNPKAFDNRTVQAFTRD